MRTLIKNLHIKNFKSVQDLTLECERVNILIGRPNAGKSNILEAISMLSAGYSTGKFMAEFARYSDPIQLFSHKNFRNTIEVNADLATAVFRFNNDTNKFIYDLSGHGITVVNDIGENTPFGQNLETYSMDVLQNGDIKSRGSSVNLNAYEGLVKKYDFKDLSGNQNQGLFLRPPHGNNFYRILSSHPDLVEEIVEFLKPNEMDLLLDEESGKLSVIYRENALISIPFMLIPDTFQRYIFHLAAIKSNRNSVLLFEEPESHSYAPFIYQLAQQIISDKGNNQYFVTTHNPYLLTPLLQETKDIALFITWYEGHQTQIKRLSSDEVAEILDYGIDVFMNLEQFIPE